MDIAGDAHHRRGAAPLSAAQSKHRLYVAGFLIDTARGEVALVRKNKPDWQKGLLNGIGGKIGPRESALQAMVREFSEEAGAYITTWEPFVTLSGGDDLGSRGDSYSVTFFVARARHLASVVCTMEAEEIVVLPLSSVNDSNSVPNLTWLLPLAMLALDGRTPALDIREVAA